MQKKIFVCLIALLVFLFPSLALGAVSYSRTPSGSTIQNPVSFDVSFDAWGDVCTATPANYWDIDITWLDGEYEEYHIKSSKNSSTTLSYDFIQTLPLSSADLIYIDVNGNCYLNYSDINGNGFLISNGSLEDGWPAFTVIEAAPEEQTLFRLPAEGLASTTAYIGDIAGTIWPFAALGAGIPLAFYVIRKIISMVSGRAR
jgi:hypothetical protein